MLRRLKIVFHYFRANAAMRRDQFDRAAERLSKVLELEPGNPYAHHDRGVALQGMGNYRGSIADLDRSIAIAPRLATAYSSRGISWKFLGDFDRAIADQLAAIALSPRLKDAHTELGAAYFCKHDFDSAVRSLTTAIDLALKEPNCLKQRGLAHFCRGDFRAAIPDLQRAFEVANDTYALLFLHLARARTDEDAATTALETDATKVRIWHWPSAVVGFYLGRVAADTMLAAAGTPDDAGEAQFYLGQWHLLRGEHAEARTALQAAAEACPPWFNEHVAAVAELQRLG
ncbi:tetratricopeptide repeat protein [Bradyrhizobium sp. U531]|uniref:tetratricopeptide repeat protein n=1 Tax=Bradyrhizobium sp. U531 TaxID=3053458 RepID=UPI003F442A83